MKLCDSNLLLKRYNELKLIRNQLIRSLKQGQMMRKKFQRPGRSQLEICSYPSASVHSQAK
jgi:hypothetical protein